MRTGSPEANLTLLVFFYGRVDPLDDHPLSQDLALLPLSSPQWCASCPRGQSKRQAVPRSLCALLFLSPDEGSFSSLTRPSRRRTPLCGPRSLASRCQPRRASAEDGLFGSSRRGWIAVLGGRSKAFCRWFSAHASCSFA